MAAGDEYQQGQVAGDHVDVLAEVEPEFMIKKSCFSCDHMSNKKYDDSCHSKVLSIISPIRAPTRG
jgi:hypothetical protein